ncbi:MAG: hypothetical protein KDN18_09850 [Verrucomicrobiae bacterium]|nr:hypothetical protein [Verrucomicrobiae bacterium]
MKNLSITLGIAASLMAFSTPAQEKGNDQPKQAKPAIESKASDKPGPEAPKGPGGPKGPEMEKRRAEIQKLMQEGRHDEARARMEAMKREMMEHHQGPGKPGGPHPPEKDGKPGGPESGKDKHGPIAGHPPGRPGPGHPGMAKIEEKRAEIRKLMQEGHRDEARKQIEAFRKEMGHGEGKEGRGFPGGPPPGGPMGKFAGPGRGPHPEMMRKAREEIMNLHREGKHEEAQKRMEEIRKHVMAERGVHHRGPHEGLPGEKHDEGDGLRGKPQPEPSAHPDAEARANHLREASEHLRAAGMIREAEHFQAMAGHLQQPDASREPAQVGGQADINRRLEGLEKSVQNLARQLEAVGAELKKRGS